MPKGVFQRTSDMGSCHSRVLSRAQESEVAALYASGARQIDIARQFQVARKVIRRTLLRLKVQLRPTNQEKSNPGPQNGSWKGGRNYDGDGYIRVYAPWHPNARGCYIAEHRLVAERFLGRVLAPEEVVHHKNGKKDDNRPCNLVLFASNGDHLAYTLAGKRPKWTADGWERILRGTRDKRMPQGIPRPKTGRTDVRRSRKKLIDRFQLSESEQPDSVPAAVLPPLPPLPKRQGTAHGTACPATSDDEWA